MIHVYFFCSGKYLNRCTGTLVLVLKGRKSNKFMNLFRMPRPCSGTWMMTSTCTLWTTPTSSTPCASAPTATGSVLLPAHPSRSGYVGYGLSRLSFVNCVLKLVKPISYPCDGLIYILFTCRILRVRTWLMNWSLMWSPRTPRLNPHSVSPWPGLLMVKLSSLVTVTARSVSGRSALHPVRKRLYWSNALKITRLCLLSYL